jgi:enterochelin esterase family protein
MTGGRISGPQAEAVGDGYRVTFWWRDPAGSEETSLTKRVWIYITGVTDHHQNAVPQTLKRVPGTDAWQWQTTLSPAWRGSYCFIPSDRDDDFAPEVFNGEPDRALLREGWRRLLPRAIADPLKPAKLERRARPRGFGAGAAAGAGTARLVAAEYTLSTASVH